jgi:hypothetical protein
MLWRTTATALCQYPNNLEAANETRLGPRKHPDRTVRARCNLHEDRF